MSAETVRIMCPNLTCRKLLAVPAAARGKMVRCRACSTNIRVPNAPAPKAPPAGQPGATPPSPPDQSQPAKKAS